MDLFFRYEIGQSRSESDRFDARFLVFAALKTQLGCAATQRARANDLFKATNKTVSALLNLSRPVADIDDYRKLVSDLYFIFRESTGQRLDGLLPVSFVDVNILRTELQHDTDHGDNGKVKTKKTQAGSAFMKYAGISSPEVLDAGRFVLVQANILSALELDMINLSVVK